MLRNTFLAYYFHYFCNNYCLESYYVITNTAIGRVGIKIITDIRRIYITVLSKIRNHRMIFYKFIIMNIIIFI